MDRVDPSNERRALASPASHSIGYIGPLETDTPRTAQLRSSLHRAYRRKDPATIGEASRVSGAGPCRFHMSDAPLSPKRRLSACGTRSRLCLWHPFKALLVALIQGSACGTRSCLYPAVSRLPNMGTKECSRARPASMYRIPSTACSLCPMLSTRCFSMIKEIDPRRLNPGVHVTMGSSGRKLPTLDSPSPTRRYFFLGTSRGGCHHVLPPRRRARKGPRRLVLREAPRSPP